MKQIPLGSRVRVTGICILEDSNPFNPQVPFNILLRSLTILQSLPSPPLLNIRNLIIVLSVLLAGCGCGGRHGDGLSNAKLRRQTGTLAVWRRSSNAAARILEDINGSKALGRNPRRDHWRWSPSCSSAFPAGARSLMERGWEASPPDADRLRVFHAGDSRLAPVRRWAMSLPPSIRQPRPPPTRLKRSPWGRGLATLAIETRRLYNDLLHRSEFDLLTDIHNRFSLEKHLDTLIEEARQSAGIFGLIYIDLDEFKQVNDLYGHHVGDLYLQEVAERMKLQLRAHDLLARLGGDEFAVLVPMVRNRAGVEEIAQRLERCFDDPFALQGHLQGAASFGIALYPEDGAPGTAC